MWQIDWAAAEHLLSPFSILFFGVKLLYDDRFRESRGDFFVSDFVALDRGCWATTWRAHPWNVPCVDPSEKVSRGDKSWVRCRGRNWGWRGHRGPSYWRPWSPCSHFSHWSLFVAIADQHIHRGVGEKMYRSPCFFKPGWPCPAPGGWRRGSPDRQITNNMLLALAVFSWLADWKHPDLPGCRWL